MDGLAPEMVAMIEDWLEGRMQKRRTKHEHDEMCAMVGVELGKGRRELSEYKGGKHQVIGQG
jgi:hypothetical protein